MALLGRARDGGDLRVAHFPATHAMHVIPLFGLVWSRTVSTTGRYPPLAIFSIGYTALATLTFWQALEGQALLG